MKKVVNSVIAFLKKKKEDFSLLRDSAPVDAGVSLDRVEAEKEDEFAVIRLCRRCVMVYEYKTCNKWMLQRISRQCDIGFDEDTAELVPPVENTDQSFDPFQENSFRSFTHVNRNRISMALTLISDHVMQRTSNSDRLKFGPHYPVFIWLRNCERSNAFRNIYQDEDNILIKVRLDMLSLASFPRPVSEVFEGTTLEVWVLAQKFSKPIITLEIDEELIIGYIADLFHVAFFNIPFSVKERQAKIEGIFRAIDEILDISAHIMMASGESSENAITVKEVITETAIVVTSTAAESTATVGIETAAMALGQAAAGIAISVLVDIALTAGSVTRSKMQRDKGLITNSQFKSTVRRKLCDSGCQFIGGTTGTIVGQVLIPVPVVGAMVGGFFGSLIGVGVSKGIIKTSELIAKAHNARAKAITD